MNVDEALKGLESQCRVFISIDRTLSKGRSDKVHHLFKWANIIISNYREAILDDLTLDASGLQFKKIDNLTLQRHILRKSEALFELLIIYL
jgi:hypothetical protein